ncbi:cysteine hydrolase [Candidatus Falkowbacteria bacterium]|uniref:Isochorismatase n=1 Tax=Candidatus Kuenenbacteria bacterium CG23_combo_of_CG06-09_8_20_14_all_39_39 TaxID=1974623 RepID=A0A2G9Z683_9BACT|nr:cysteine hydrolase [Candidatus Falkowbacteria bacterium]PIP28677.1 MAG: isochorismatase [Candidatus Kuenenbacteria bacterium CG23_combo_of_CG06-09_8_20_14_all_39_39]
MTNNMESLLLIIGMQKGFRYAESEALLPNLLKLKKSFKGKIVFSKFVNDKDSLFEKQLNWTEFQNEEDKKLFSELRASNNIEFEHNGYTVINEALLQFIKENKIIKVYLCGIYTDVCITKTAMDLFDKGIETFVIEDACNSLHGKSIHDSAIESLRHILGKKQILLTNDVCL